MVNHGIVTQGEIGTSPSNAVQCRTTVTDCCNDDDPHTGQWFFPNGNMVQSNTTKGNLPGQGTRLCVPTEKNVVANGIYRCEIGVAGNKEIYYVGVYTKLRGKHIGKCVIGNLLYSPCNYCTVILVGAVTITGQLEFKLLSAMTAATPMFTLICTSARGPATSITWTSPAGAFGTESQIVTNMTTATYSNTLTIDGRYPGDYTCSVSNVRNTEPATKTLTVTGEFWYYHTRGIGIFIY